MKKVGMFLGMLMMSFSLFSQAFEGLLKVSYKDDKATIHTADVKVKDKKFFIQKLTGGNEKYEAYIFDSEKRELICISPSSPKTAILFNADKVFQIYEKKNLKAGFHVTVEQKVTGAIPKKTSTAATFSAELTEDVSNVNFKDLIPVLRITGFWNEAQDGNNNIMEASVKNIKSGKISTVKVVKQKSAVNETAFVIPKGIQKVDLNKFINEQGGSPKLPALIKAFAGF